MDEAALTVTLKAGADFSAPWVVVRANDQAELLSRLAAVRANAEDIVAAANTLKAINNAAPLLDGGAVQRAQQSNAQAQNNVQQGPWNNSQPVQQTVVLHPEGRRCASCNAPVQWKEFDSKTGNHIKLWTCPNQRSKDDGHYSQFVR